MKVYHSLMRITVIKIRWCRCVDDVYISVSVCICLCTDVEVIVHTGERERKNSRTAKCNYRH